MFLSKWRKFPPAPCLAEKKLDDSSRLDVVEIARVPGMLPSLFPSWSGYGLIITPVPFPENQDIYEKMWQNMVKPDVLRITT